MNERGTRLARNLNWIFTGLLVIAGVGLVVLTLATAFAAISPDTLAERMQARTPGGPIDLTVGYNAAWTMGWAVAILAVFAFIIVQLRGMMATVAAGRPFVAENVGRLRRVAMAMGALVVVQLGAGFLVPPSIGDASVGVGRFDFGLFLGMLVVLVLAEVFREGVRLSDEAEGTI